MLLWNAYFNQEIKDKYFRPDVVNIENGLKWRSLERLVEEQL